MASKDTDDSKPDADEADVSLDMSQAAVKKMIADARERGYITYEQLNQCDAARAGVVGADRRRDVDAVRDGHQRHRRRGC